MRPGGEDRAGARFREEIGRIVDFGVEIGDGAGNTAAHREHRAVRQQSGCGVVAAVVRGIGAHGPLSRLRVPDFGGIDRVRPVIVCKGRSAGDQDLTIRENERSAWVLTQS
jgi:hypothetical protein